MELHELAAILGGANFAHYLDIHVLRYLGIGARNRTKSSEDNVLGPASTKKLKSILLGVFDLYLQTSWIR